MEGMTSVALNAVLVSSLSVDPVFVAIFSSSLTALGIFFLAREESQGQWSGKSGRSEYFLRRGFSKGRQQTFLACSLSAAAVSTVVLLWTKSLVITAPFSIFAVVITWAYRRNKAKRQADAMSQVWPEVTDHLSSAIHSGLSLPEAMVGLSDRGPEIIRPYFVLFHKELMESGDFSASIRELKARLNTHGSDQILEAILLAKSLGGSELLQIFRTLGDFLRQDLALRREIEIKHGWIKNSAHMSAAAPWLLLLLLSSQPGTSAAFAQPGGVAILFVGLFLTSIAYLWMGKLGQLPTSPRVFG